MLLGSGWAGRVGVGAHEMAKSELQRNPNNYINATCKAKKAISKQQLQETVFMPITLLFVYSTFMYVRMHIGR